MKKALFILLASGLQYAYGQKDYSFVYHTDSIINTGTRLHDEGKFAEAIKEYEKVAKTDPGYGTALYEKALSLSSMGKDEETKKFFKELYDKKIMVGEPAMFMLYANFLSDKKDYETSDKIFAEAVTATPNNSNVYFNYAILKLRKEETQAAADLLKKAITINPNHASAHYFLSLLAFQSGKITEGCLAALSYLVIAPDGRYADQAIEMLNAKMGENYLKKDNVVYSKSGDNFSDIDEILRNQLPLKKAYKVNSEFNDDPIMRQLQAVCEYSLEHKMGEGFFENTYLPWVKKMMQDKQFENMSYYILLSMEEKLGKKLTSHKKQIMAFADYIAKDFWDYFALRKMEHFGKVETVNISMKNGRPYIVGVLVGGKKEGKYKVLDELGRTLSELNFKNDEFDGLQKYFDAETNLVTGETEYKNGKLHGTKKDFFTNGQLNLVQQYADDKLNGISTSYYVNGGKQCEVNFVNDQRSGKLVCLYPNGSMKSEEVYANGKLNGTHISYNQVGDITEKYQLKDDLIDGPYLSYFDGKALKEEATYANGKINGKFKSYFENQAIDEERTYENGNLRKVLSYWADGKLASESTYDDKGKIESYLYFDRKGNKYYEERYRGGELKTGMQYGAGKPKPTEFALGKKPFKILSFEGDALVTGEYEAGSKSKEWNYYFNSGTLKSKDNYKAGKKDGLSTVYNKNGTLTMVRHFSDDKINGLYEDYDNGVLNGKYYFANGEKNGPYTTYEADGSIASEGFNENDENNYVKTFYRFDGSVLNKSTYINGVEILSEEFNRKGESVHATDYKNKTGKFDYLEANNMVNRSIELVNGELNGKNIRKDKTNSPIMDEEYKNGVNVNKYFFYTPGGAVQVERNFYCGKYHGPQKWYDHAGNLRIEENYLFGDEYGKGKRFYQNKTTMLEEEYADDELAGEATYFNLKGQPILKLGYDNNQLVYFIRFGKTGALDDKVAVTKETADVASMYANGKTAIAFKMVKGNYEGKFVIHSEEGKPVFETNYIHGLTDGERTEYYTSGKVYKKEHLKNGDFEGTQEYFGEDGKPLIVVNYKNNKLHGNTVIYSKTGQITKKYDSNDLVEIIR
ncbi:hypothetical protein [Flavobacterium sp.]|uniref:hypothetical protein n=1 Tax=Flavobacterium sp. TaxID=239 RepID=UPI0039E47724